MTIIDQKGGNFWIEAVTVPRAAVGSGSDTELNTEITLERPGVFLGCAVTLDSALVASDVDTVQLSLQVGGSNNALTIGTEITSVRLRRYNQSSDQIFGAYVLVYMRKNGQPS